MSKELDEAEQTISAMHDMIDTLHGKNLTLHDALKLARAWMPQQPGDDMPLARSDLATVDAALALSSQQGKTP